ncbi:uncharacterized protein [Coffea arabica]|uniref:RNA-directed DNA polymerase (Reverse transcriptase) n=1 Tax=Coffea arabica TaxID=13443 RepID=A0A6P6UV94_COFAR|nr:uncharacterized protein LOC113713983 [Coffea arabica]
MSSRQVGIFSVAGALDSSMEVGGIKKKVLDASEKRGGRSFHPDEAMDFGHFMHDTNLLDVGFSGCRFMRCNTRHGGARIWKRLDQVLANEIICNKLKRLKRAIQVWNKQVFGDIFQAVKLKEDEVRTAEVLMESDNSEGARENLHRAQAQLHATLQAEKLFWKQKARVKWLQEGDRNTKFFHSTVKQRRVHFIIHKIKNEQGEWVESEEDIGNETVRFFE